MTGGELAALVLCVAITAAALVAILWISEQPPRKSPTHKVIAGQQPMWTYSRPVVRCDAESPAFGKSAAVLCEKPVGHVNAHRCGETTWLLANGEIRDGSVRAS